MKFLIDTNICIYLMNNRSSELIQKFKSIEIGQIGISSITISELYYGMAKSWNQGSNQKRLEEFLVPFEILAYDEIASKHYGEIRYDLEKRGEVIGPLDLLIAAHALSRDLVLVTNNEKKFQRIQQLKVENWSISTNRD